MPSSAEENTYCNQSNNTTIITNNIFDLEEDGTIFIHKIGNFFHIKTKDKTIINESSFFMDKCQVTNEDLNELERHLRSKKYIQSASVTRDDEGKVIIETFDTWSLMPTVDFGRKGGKNSSAAGIKERNLLGLGIDTEIEYFDNDQRTGYKFDTEFPFILQNNTSIKTRFTNNDDGGSESVFIQKKFASFDTKNSYNIGFNNFRQIDTQYEIGEKSKQYNHDKDFSTASWRWLHEDTQTDTIRLGIGITKEHHLFSSTPPPLISKDSNIPLDRKFNYPFITFEYLQKDYRELTNFNLISNVEDFNFGWNFNANIGGNVFNDADTPSIIFQANSSTGFDLANNSIIFSNVLLESEIYDKSKQKNRLLLTFETEYYKKINDRWGGYLKNRTTLSKNQHLDSPVVLGDKTGVRGFPLQYQHGDHSTQFTFETRYYPHINIYKLLELGGAFFIDTGRVYGRTELSQQKNPWMTSIGIGARFYSVQSSEAKVIHIDLTKPITSDPNADGIEFRITTKHSF
tara:strand:- start:40968 stop:42512 length:1545 start_codon:yes stop_codon:yes gene_type:complete